MLILLASPLSIAPKGVPDSGLVTVLLKACADGHPVGVVSNSAKPDWFDKVFGGTDVQFLETNARQNGRIIQENAERLGLRAYDALVLATKLEDVQMGKNGGAVLVAAGWSTEARVANLGINVGSATEFQQVIALSAAWAGDWWLSGDQPLYSVRSLADLSGYRKPITQQEFASKLTATVKGGGARLNALLAIASRSLLVEGLGARASNLVWGVYPSSQSANNDSDTLSDFTHRLRTTVSKVRFAERGHPLFIRHAASTKRSLTKGGNRTEPSEQIATLHLNPHYRGRIAGKHVVIVDDCTTYGVSFGVAAAFLRRAGASNVLGVAMGKFGDQLGYYDIDIQTDPFAAVPKGGYILKQVGNYQGTTNIGSQAALQALLQ